MLKNLSIFNGFTTSRGQAVYNFFGRLGYDDSDAFQGKIDSIIISSNNRPKIDKLIGKGSSYFRVLHL